MTPSTFTQTPVEPVLPKPPFPKWPLIAAFTFFLGIASVFAYQRFLPTRPTRFNLVGPSPSPATVVSPLPAIDLTTDWKIYQNDKFKITFQYPGNLTLQENIININHTQLIFNKDEANYFTISFSVNYAPNQVEYLIDTEAFDTKTINNGKWSVYDLSLNTGLQLEKNNVLYSVNYPPSRESEVNFILSTFKFLDAAEPEAPITSLEKIPTISTSNWKNASNNGVRFKIPSEADCNDNQACTLVSWTSQYQENTLYHSIRVEVRDYLGGSRREQFYSNIKPECHDVYQEASFGTVRVLQIAIDGGWCQGGGGGIIAVVGDKLVIIHNLAYDDKKIINRWDIRDTLVSTLEAI